MDLASIPETVALIAATGAVTGLSEDSARHAVHTMRERLRKLFCNDARSIDALDRACEDPTDRERISDLTSALKWYADRDPAVAAEFAEWAENYSVTNIEQNMQSSSVSIDATTNFGGNIFQQGQGIQRNATHD
ncbi:hypothetical protein [Actinomadura hibisca]|uniref:hypothetical protein n=1 Tax=Actinomadura hibisca TaxID=68565 RepID=UPI0012FBD229|nr:hypothetical protein [Actinomadura hibisca]